jgi:hypothetical protein
MPEHMHIRLIYGVQNSHDWQTGCVDRQNGRFRKAILLWRAMKKKKG